MIIYYKVGKVKKHFSNSRIFETVKAIMLTFAINHSINFVLFWSQLTKKNYLNLNFFFLKTAQENKFRFSIWVLFELYMCSLHPNHRSKGSHLVFEITQ